MGSRGGRTMGAVLRGQQARWFVGREAECRLFADALGAAEPEWRILNVHGVGGIGKSTLLDAFGRVADQVGAHYCQVDCVELPHSPRRLAERLAVMFGARVRSRGAQLGLQDCLAAIRGRANLGPVAIAFDSYEAVGPADRWLREVLLPSLPERVVIVVAGRIALPRLWRDRAGWRPLIRAIPLAPFDRPTTRRYLGLHGIDDRDLSERAWEVTQGHPLALSLLAALVARHGLAALARWEDRPDLVAELSRRWLREVPDPRLHALVEAASAVRHFDQDLLGDLEREPVAAADFDRLTALSFVRPGQGGWRLQGLVRSALVRDLRWRSPARLRQLKHRALEHHARRLTQAEGGEWGGALAEFFYLLGDALIGAAFFGADEQDADEVYVVPATAEDLGELEQYARVCRERAATGGPAEFGLYDPGTGRRFRYQYLWVDFVRAPLDFRTVLDLGPGTVRLARDARGALRGISVVIPVNATTLPRLASQPVTGPYFRSLAPEQRAEYAVAAERTAAWFLRHLSAAAPEDSAARGVLLQDLFRIAFREGRLLTTSPAPFFQDLLLHTGFVPSPGATHHDFGPDLASPTYVLDVRGARLADLLTRLLEDRDPAPAGANMPAELAHALARHLTGMATVAAADRADDDPLRALTPRERTIALAVVEGLSNAEIADRLGIRPLTAKKHLTHVFAKVGVASRTQLIRRMLGGT